MNNFYERLVQFYLTPNNGAFTHRREAEANAAATVKYGAFAVAACLIWLVMR